MPNGHGPEITPIRFTQRVSLEVDAWPQRTAFGEDWLLNQAHRHGATVLGDTVTFSVANGGATYHLRYDLDPVNGDIVADLVKPDEDSPSENAPGKQKKSAIQRENAGVVRVSRGTVG